MKQCNAYCISLYVSVMPVRVADGRIQHQHIIERSHILRADFLIV